MGTFEKIDYIKWGFESRLKLILTDLFHTMHYIKWGFESRLKSTFDTFGRDSIISNGDLRVG